MVKNLVLCFCVFLLFPSVLWGTDWMYLIDSENGEKNYIDMDSIRHSSAQTVRVSKKREAATDSGFPYIISDIEIDCKERRARVLRQSTYYDANRIERHEGDGTWKSIKADDLEELLIELLCGLKKGPGLAIPSD